MFFLLGVFADSAHHAGIGEAAAENPLHGPADLLVCGIGVGIERGLGGEDDAAEAEAALRGAVFDEGTLDWVRVLGRAEAVQSGNLDHQLRQTTVESPDRPPLRVPGH
jgi:hypothetical protein